MKRFQLLFFLLLLTELVSACWVQLEIVSLTRKRFSAQIFGPFFRYQAGKFDRGLGERQSYHFDGSLFSCHGAYEVLLTPVRGGSTYYFRRDLKEDSTVVIHVRNHHFGFGVVADTDYYMA